MQSGKSKEIRDNRFVLRLALLGNDKLMLFMVRFIQTHLKARMRNGNRLSARSDLLQISVVPENICTDHTRERERERERGGVRESERERKRDGERERGERERGREREG